MWAELHPEFIFYIYKEGTPGALRFSATGQERREGGGQLSTTCVVDPFIVGDLPDDIL